MLSNTTTAVLAQEKSEHPETERKVGVEIVRSADLPGRFFKSRKAASYSLRDDLWSRCLKAAMR